MIRTFNGLSINAKPPISNISVNKFNVAFEDCHDKKYVPLKSAMEAKKFVAWLLAI
ncbi:hypothetical protein [uncultured Alteromonas sp.]|jgi:hypothetical protein|uniref:hypothetical protein n=1 Tax=uncultured Alteromonas sp. TaxID=179113 RepID=UPI0025DFFFE7|nr:hypothetical protein [uncultured Alteromonas sp.]